MLECFIQTFSPRLWNESQKAELYKVYLDISLTMSTSIWSGSRFLTGPADLLEDKEENPGQEGGWHSQSLGSSF